MKKLLILCVVMVSACAEPGYTRVGMSYNSFAKLCGVTVNEILGSHTISNSQGDLYTVVLENTQERRDKHSECFGRFTFINNKLDTIVR